MFSDPANPVIAGLRRADQILYEQVGEKITLDYGIAFFDAEFPDAHEDNAFREVLVDAPGAMPRAWDEVQRFYGQRQLQCYRWVPALGQSWDIIEPFLLDQGWFKKLYHAMYIPDWPDLAMPQRIRILPARAMRKFFRRLHDDARTGDIEERRLDYAQFDVFVATVDGEPAGRCGLLQAGEIAKVRDLFVVEPVRRQGVGTALLAHVLELARRLMMKVVCAEVPADNQAGLDFLAASGFRREGQMVEFHRP